MLFVYDLLVGLILLLLLLAPKVKIFLNIFSFGCVKIEVSLFSNKIRQILGNVILFGPSRLWLPCTYLAASTYNIPTCNFFLFGKLGTSIRKFRIKFGSNGHLYLHTNHGLSTLFNPENTMPRTNVR